MARRNELPAAAHAGRYAGHRYKLTHGKYQLVRLARRAARAHSAKYGPLLGSSSFVVR